MANQNVTLVSPITATVTFGAVWVNLKQDQNVTLVTPVQAEVYWGDTPIRITQTVKPQVHAGTMGIDNSPTKRYVPQFTGPGGKKHK